MITSTADKPCRRAVAAALLACVGLIGCEKPSPRPPPTLTPFEAAPIVDRVINLGWLKFVPDGQKAEVRQQLIEAATSRYLDSDWDKDGVSTDRRSYPADNEELAKGDVGKTILLMKAVLEREGVKLETVVDDLGDEKYEVVINDTPHLVYEGEVTMKTWEVSLRRLIEIVNGLLEDAGSAERLFASYGGNDGRVILLTDEMQDYVESIGDVLDHRWMPRGGGAIDIGRHTRRWEKSIA